jgi:hypothetical protein
LPILGRQTRNFFFFLLANKCQLQKCLLQAKRANKGKKKKGDNEPNGLQILCEIAKRKRLFQILCEGRELPRAII